MKKVLFIALLALSASCGSIRHVNDGYGELTEDYAKNNLSKKDNYILSNEWMVESFNNAKSVIQFSDKEAGIVKGKYNLYSGYDNIGYKVDEVSAIITLRAKDSVVKIEIDGRNAEFVRIEATGIYDGGPLDNVGFSKSQAKARVARLIESFKARLNNK